MRSIVRSLLQEIAITNIAEAGDGCTALGKLRGDTFDLVISDWNMEPMSGLQLLKEVRADNKLAKLPFIMMTGETQSRECRRERSGGEQLHRQAVQRHDTEAEDRSRGWRTRRARISRQVDA